MASSPDPVRRMYLLTGGTGFFGRALLRHWQALQCTGEPVPRVTVLSRSPRSFLTRYPEFEGLPWLAFQEGDILDPRSLPRTLRFTHVIHAAADSTLGAQLPPIDRYRQIVDGTRNLLEYAVTHGARRFLFTSSGAVYGPQPASVAKLAEDFNAMPDPLVATNAYGVAKRCAEHLCALYRDQYGIETVVTRCFAFVGRDLPFDVHFAIGNFIRDALRAGEITVSGDGRAVRSYMDQRDLARWLVTLCEQGCGGEAYNVGSDEAISVGELAHLVRDVLAPRKSVCLRGSAPDPNGRSRYVPDVAKAAALGLRLTYGLREAIVGAAALAMPSPRKPTEEEDATRDE